MKTGFWILAGLLLISLTVNGILLIRTVNLAVGEDHSMVQNKTNRKREIALLRFTRAFGQTLKKEELKTWIRSHMSDLEIYDQQDQIIVNGVEFRFDTDPIEVN